MAAVFAQLSTAGEDQGVHAFARPDPRRDGTPLPGVRIEDCGLKAGLNGVDNGRLYFDDVRVPRENLLDRYGDVAADGTYSTPIENKNARFFTMLGTLVQGRISVAGGAGSAAKVALTIAVRYGEERRQFAGAGQRREIAMLDYLAHQRKLLPALAKTYALHFAQLELVELLHETPLARRGRRATARSRATTRAGASSRPAPPGIKAIATWHATRTIQDCREACGGAGYLAENRLPGLKADTDVFTTFEGDNTVLLQLVAKELLTGYRDHFGELDPLGTARFVADQAFETVLEKVGARRLVAAPARRRARRDDEAELLDRGWQLELFDYREQHMLDTLARRLRRAADADDPFADLQRRPGPPAARRPGARRPDPAAGLRRRVERCDGRRDPRAALDRVCDLFALSTIEADRGWFLEHGRLTAARSKAVIAEVNRLCEQLRPHALPLIDAFGIPEAAIAAPIAQGAEQQREPNAGRAPDYHHLLAHAPSRRGST